VPTLFLTEVSADCSYFSLYYQCYLDIFCQILAYYKLKPVETKFINPEHAFVINFATTAYGYGVSLSRLEAAMKRFGKALGFTIQVMSNGSTAHFVFWQDVETQQQSYFVHLPAANPDLTKLVLLEDLGETVAAGVTSAPAGITRLKEIKGMPVKFGPWANTLAFGLIGAAVAVVFSSPWIDILFGGLLGALVYGIVILAGRLPWVGKSLEFVTAFVAAILANILAIVIPGSNPFVLVICAVAMFIPGFLLTMGLTEIMLHYTVSGINRLVNGIVITVKLFVGALIGTSIVQLLWTVPPATAPAAIPPIALWTFIALLYVGIALFLQVRPKDAVWVILVGLLTYAGMTLVNQLGFWQGPFLGALVLGLSGNVVARWKRLPATLVTLPGVMALMPGVIAYIGLFNMTASGVEALSTAAIQIMVTAIAIVIGVIVANTLVSPKLTL
jgi:uncharacterized membrane protein YjjP (DUF1212 family)